MGYKKEEWNLKDILSEKDIPRLLSEVELITKKIESYKSRFNNKISEKKFREIIANFEKLHLSLAKIQQYAALLFSENTKNQKAIALETKINEIDTDISNRLLWFSLNFVDFPEKDIKRLIGSCPHIKYYLEQIVKNKKYKLKENEEKIINIKDKNGIEIIDRIYEILSSNLLFDFKGKKVTQEELVNEVRNPSPKIRELAYKTLINTYSQHKEIIGEIYKAVVSDWHDENIFLRKYPSPISVRNKSQDISEKTIETLIKVTQKNQILFQKYFKLKAKRLKIKKLSRTDIYAPLKKSKEKINYSEAADKVLSSFKNFSEIFYNEARNILDKKHIHSTIQRGKRGGGFCSSSIPEIYPYILINFTDNYESTTTLAHELGHAIHFILSAKKQNIFNAHSALPIAETASIFSELILIEKLKKENPSIAKELIFQQLDQLYGTIARQIEFVEFEKEIHNIIKNSPTIDEISDLYLNRIKKHFGPEMYIPNYFKYEWLYIRHIFNTPFYCYAYAFGNLLSLAVYSAYLENKNTKQKLIQMLSGGSSKSPKDLVKGLGFDIDDERFWQKGFDQIGRMIKEIE